MRQTTVIGILSGVEDLSLHENTGPGLHYARSVLVLSAAPDDVLPPTGRGRAVAGSESGQLRLNRMIVCWGSDSEVAKLVKNADRPCVFGVVKGRSNRSKRAIQALRANNVEAHLLVMKEGSAARIVGSDAGKPVIQWSTPEGWVEVAESSPSAPAAPQEAATAPDASQPQEQPSSAPEGE